MGHNENRVPFHIRSAVPADAAQIFALVTELAAYEKLSAAVDATAETLAQALFGTAPRVFCDMAEQDGEPIGLAVWFYTFSTFRGRHGIWLEDLYVRPAFRGRGTGKALLAGLAARCVRENLARLEWSVLDWNTPSIAFYKAMGAVLMDEWTNCRCEGGALSSLAALAAGKADPVRI
ncbi:GNAT family N-acetyltransferase [Methyloferula stellata]|uniref:GNAT family N-acetyltransferase n=1 Tax=Methyloferula stellata TaxID=876270 RepID=UPI0003AA9A38|nr:GNAT family N-acetyltransferase [Methyloferula stellata]